MYGTHKLLLFCDKERLIGVIAVAAIGTRLSQPCERNDRPRSGFRPRSLRVMVPPGRNAPLCAIGRSRNARVLVAHSVGSCGFIAPAGRAATRSAIVLCTIGSQTPKTATLTPQGDGRRPPACSTRRRFGCGAQHCRWAQSAARDGRRVSRLGGAGTPGCRGNRRSLPESAQPRDPRTWCGSAARECRGNLRQSGRWCHHV